MQLNNAPSTFKVDEQQSWQSGITKLIRIRTLGTSSIHLRRRLDRWDLVTLPGHRVLRATEFLRLLGDTSSPRIQAAYLRTICNGWCTKRRFQNSGGCSFGCGGGEDSIEHFAHCRLIREWFFKCLQLNWRSGNGALDDFLCITRNESTPEELIGGFAPCCLSTRMGMGIHAL